MASGTRTNSACPRVARDSPRCRLMPAPGDGAAAAALAGAGAELAAFSLGVRQSRSAMAGSVTARALRAYLQGALPREPSLALRGGGGENEDDWSGIAGQRRSLVGVTEFRGKCSALKLRGKSEMGSDGASAVH